MKLKNSTKNILLIMAVIILLSAPLIFLKDAAFEGSDGQAEDVISEINPSYEPWFSSLIVPASGEIESLLFALQAALGAAVIGYFYGFVRGKRSVEYKSESEVENIGTKIK